MLQKPLEALNMIYPDKSLDKYIAGEDTEFNESKLVGKGGLSRLMRYEETFTPPSRFNYEYKNDTYGNIFSPQEIEKYSAKISTICNIIKQSKGIILIYSQWIDGGLIPLALALEELGFTRYGDVKSLFKNSPAPSIDAITQKTKAEHKGEKFNPAKYVMITGEKTLSPQINIDIKALTNNDNKNGELVKVVLISQAGSEGLDFKNIRQVHILDPWYNMNRIEQIMGRAIRTCSHKELAFIERNVEIYLYGSLLDNNMEAVDLYVYRLAELKALQMGRVSRVLKENAVDCLLNLEQLNFVASKLKKEVKQKLSSGQTINYKVGDKPYSSICDYMDSCSYTCNPTKKLELKNINLDTYSESFIIMNTEKIIQRIKNLFKEQYFYSKDILVKHINIQKEYPDIQINSALTQLIEDKNEFLTDKYNRLGNLINIGNMYLFQPLELNNKNISLYDRSVPLEYKRDKLAIKIPKDFSDPTIQIEEKDETNIENKAIQLLETIKKEYNTGITEQEYKRGEENPYIFCSLAIHRLIKEGYSKEILDGLLIDHILELLNFSQQIQLLDYLYNNKFETKTLEYKLKQYYEDRLLVSNEITGLLLQNKGNQQLMLYKEDKWIKGEGGDYIILANEIKKLIPISKLNDFVGFIANFKKENFLVFKTKDMMAKRNSGALCDSMKKKFCRKTNKYINGR